ncbi:MAG: ABC transporter substrate-binding protein [Bacteroidetes bacterium]|nr:ABC transporter substrate-binding protein [Bacteroidota bacterium]
MPITTDQMHRKVEVPKNPQRIISLVPSQTELLYYLGLTDEVVGQTLFCVHPPEMHESKPRVGGTKKINFEKIKELQPDLIIGNKEENDQQQMEELMKLYPVWMSDIKNLSSAFEMILKVGYLIRRDKKAKELVVDIQKRFHLVKEAENKKCIYLIWKNPWMVAGNDTFINEILTLKGYINLVKGRYPELTTEQLAELKPESILLSSEPYPFKDKHIEELKHYLPHVEIKLVDGELYSWYGSRMLYI